MKHLFVRSLYLSTHQHIEISNLIKVTAKLVWIEGTDLLGDLFDRRPVLLSLLRNKGRVIVREIIIKMAAKYWPVEFFSFKIRHWMSRY